MAVWWEAVQSLKNETQRDLFTFLLFTGTRISEPLNLGWRDVDLRRKVFVLRNTKNGSTAEMPMPEIVTSALHTRKQKTENRKQKTYFQSQHRKRLFAVSVSKQISSSVSTICGEFSLRRATGWI
jgi:integrase